MDWYSGTSNESVWIIEETEWITEEKEEKEEGDPYISELWEFLQLHFSPRVPMVLYFLSVFVPRIWVRKYFREPHFYVDPETEE